MSNSEAGSVPLKRPIPGEREPGRLTRFGRAAASGPTVPEGPTTMDAVTVAERQREGGGAPSERRPAGARSRWNGVVEFLKSF
jgi:hypothetical protein